MQDKQETGGASSPGNFLVELTVAEAAAAIRQGEISSEAYAGALLERARAHSDLNAFITIDNSVVLSAAQDADKARAAGLSAPLLGVPLAIKDSYLTQGLRTTLGVGNLSDFVPDEDAEMVGSIKRAGAIVFGKNNLVEMSFGLTGNNEPYGQVSNPHRTDTVAGGSSSGAGASVAARLVPAAFGGDTIGSIRVPAAFCGVVGFKPTTGRWSGNGIAPISPTLDTAGLLARSVEDCALIDQLVTGAAAAPLGTKGIKGVRLAHAPRQFLELVDPEVEAQFRETLRRLSDAGAEVVEIDLGDDFSSLALQTTWGIFFHELKDAVTDFLGQHHVPTTFEAIHQGLKPGLRDNWSYMAVPTGDGYLSRDAYADLLAKDRPEIQRRYEAAFKASGAAAILLPTTPCPAPLIAQQSTFVIGSQEVSFTALANNTIPASAAGLPGISIPTGLSRGGLPLGLEIDGAHGSDTKLLDLAQRIETIVGERLPLA